MGLGLTLRARAHEPDPLAAIEQLVDALYEDLVVWSHRDDKRYLVQLYPAAETVGFTLDDGIVIVSAKTSGVGPGYHAFVCGLLQQLGLDWRAGDEGDETGYYATGDRDALEAEMLSWLKGLAGLIAERLAERRTNLMISLPTGNEFEYEGAIATPMGPRDAAWVERVRENPREGIDIFPWWEPGCGARYLRDRAIARMWTEVCWRKPVNENERALLEQIDDNLREAHELDPSLELPWAEWAEIAGYVDRDDPTAGRGANLTPTIGYRRKPVRATLTGGWTVRIPGHMATEIDEKGTWSGFTPGRAIWMSSFTIGDPDAPTRTAAQTLPKRAPDGEPIELPELPAEFAYRTHAGTTSEGDPKLSLEIALPHRIAVFTIVHEDADDLEWAKETASSVRHGRMR